MYILQPNDRIDHGVPIEHAGQDGAVGLQPSGGATTSFFVAQDLDENGSIVFQQVNEGEKERERERHKKREKE